MKAALIQSPGILEIQEIPEPILGEYDALCSVLCASVCNGTDHHAIQGNEFFNIRYPTILGHEGIGKVIQVGSKVQNLAVGDLVTRVVNKMPESSGISCKDNWGSFAERGIVTDWQAMRDDGVAEAVWRPRMINQKLPADFDPIASTMIITWRETLAFLRRMQLQPGQKILILGSGANALTFVEHARNAGAHITVRGSARRSGLFTQAGAANFIAYDSPDADDQVNSAGPYDIIIDAVGHAASMNSALPSLKAEGKIAVYGLNEATKYSLSPFAIEQGFTFYNGIQYEEGTTHDEVVDLIKQGHLSAELYISPEHIYPFSRIHDALDANQAGKVLKSVIDFRL